MRSLLLWAGCLTLTLSLGTPLRAEEGAPSSPPAVSEPEDVGVLVRRLGKDRFRPLEMHHAQQESDFGFFAGQLTYLTVPGERSPVRFAPGEPIEFVLRVFLDSSDPRAAFFPVKDPTRFSLYKMERERRDRRVILRDEGFTDIKRNAGRPLLIRLFGESCFLLSPGDPLEPGEYAIKYSFEDHDRVRLFCFGIDAGQR